MTIAWQNAPSQPGTQDLAAALAQLRGSDTRPLLLRRATGDDEQKLAGKLEQALKGEEVQLASHWFRCVKISGDPRQSGHDLHRLFGTRAWLVAVTADGATVVPVAGTSSKDVFKGLVAVLQKAYAKDAAAAVKSWQRLLSKFDALDDRQKSLQQQRDDAKAKGKAAQAKAIDVKLAQLDRERADALAQEKTIRELPPRGALGDPARPAGDE